MQDGCETKEDGIDVVAFIILVCANVCKLAYWHTLDKCYSRCLQAHIMPQVATQVRSVFATSYNCAFTFTCAKCAP